MAVDYSPPWVDALTPPPGKKRPLARGLLVLVVAAIFAVIWLLSHKEQLGGLLYDSAIKQGRAVVAAPDKASAAQADEAINHFTRVIRWADGTEAAFKALQQIGSIAMARGNFEEARRAYEPICARYFQHRGDCLMSRVFVGRTYEAEGRLDEAARVYEDMERYGPWSMVWYQAPLYPAQMYARYHQPEKASKSYETALKTYLRLIKSTKDPYEATELTWQAVLAYEDLENWRQAGALLAASIKDPILMPEQLPRFMLELARVLEKQMRISEAKTAYRQLLERFPKSPEAEAVRKQVKWIEDES